MVFTQFKMVVTQPQYVGFQKAKGNAEAELYDHRHNQPALFAMEGGLVEFIVCKKKEPPSSCLGLASSPGSLG